MYKENEKLKLLVDYEKDNPEKFIPKGTELTFVKAVDVGTGSFVIAKYGTIHITLPEIAVAPTETDTIAELKKFNKILINSNPELGVYHHNVIVRVFNRFKLFMYNIFILPVKKFLTKNSQPVKVEHDLSDLKNILNDNNDYEEF